MREVVLRVPREAVEGVLDRVLPAIPGGVRQREHNDETELRLRGPDLPSLEEVVALCGLQPLRAWEHEIPDAWRERRVADYEPDVIAGRLVIAPDWAPASGAEIELVLEEGAAFGSASHPTTRRCLELLLELDPAGSFADLGCGTGVLAILAARLGWQRVLAVDVSPPSVDSARRNAQANGVVVQGLELDLLNQSPPPTEAFAANVAPHVHGGLAAQLPDPVPRLGVLSGFHPTEADAVLSGYEARGLRATRREDIHGWTVAVVTAALSERVR